MSEKGRGRSRGRASLQKSQQPGPSQQLPHAQPSSSHESRRPGQTVAQTISTVSIFHMFYVFKY